MIKLLIEEINQGLIDLNDPLNFVSINEAGRLSLNNQPSGFAYFSKRFDEISKNINLYLDFSSLRSSTGLDKVIDDINKTGILSLTCMLDLDKQVCYVTYLATYLKDNEDMIEYQTDEY